MVNRQSPNWWAQTLRGAGAGASLALGLQLRGGLRIPLPDRDGLPAEVLASLPSTGTLAWTVALGLVAGAGFAFVRLRQGRTGELDPLFAAALGIAIWLPGVFQHFPFAAAFSGPFLDILLLSSVANVIWRLVQIAKPTFGSWNAVRVGLVLFATYLTLGFSVARSVGLSGDEPHYLLMTYSLLHDGDLEVENNYSDEDYRAFYGGRIGPHLGHGSRYSVHGIGLPVLLLPGFALAGLAGVLVTEAFLGALCGALVFVSTLRLTGDRGASLAASGAIGLTVPTLFLSVAAYPELPAALVVTAMFARLLDERPLSAGLALGCGFLCGLFPLLHVKFIPLALILLAAATERFRAQGKELLAGAGAGWALVLGYTVVSTGSWNPTAGYGRPRVFLEAIPNGLAGLLFDQEFGLLAAAPVYLLGFAGLYPLLHRNRRAGLYALAVLAAVALPGSAHPLWSGGTSPPARFLFPALPILAVAFGCVWSWQPERGFVPWARPLLAASLLLAGAAALLPGQPLYLNARDGTGRLWEALSSSWDLSAYVPSVVRMDDRSLALVLLGVLWLLAAVISQRFPRRLPLLPLSLAWLLVAWLVDAVLPERPTEFRARFMLSLAEGLSRGDPNQRFAVLPGKHLLDLTEAARLVAIPLQSNPRDRDATVWRSRPLTLPPGNYLLSGAGAEQASFCNGEGCFQDRGLELATRLPLGQFHVRAPRPLDSGVLKAQAIRAFGPIEALRTFSLSPSVRLHGLDDHAYLDPKGFWVKSASAARFALEGPCGGDCRIRLSNGAAENWIEVVTSSKETRFRLAPWADRTVGLLSEETFTVGCSDGFRPSDLDPTSRDDRALGLRIGPVVSKNPEFIK